jgi:hypothetical protein
VRLFQCFVVFIFFSLAQALKADTQRLTPMSPAHPKAAGCVIVKDRSGCGIKTLCPSDILTIQKVALFPTIDKRARPRHQAQLNAWISIWTQTLSGNNVFGRALSGTCPTHGIFA